MWYIFIFRLIGIHGINRQLHGNFYVDPKIQNVNEIIFDIVYWNTIHIKEINVSGKENMIQKYNCAPGKIEIPVLYIISKVSHFVWIAVTCVDI